MEPDTNRRNDEFWNFVAMSILFSLNHGCVVSCLSLATARLGNVGAWQSGILYFTYAVSGLFGSTAIVKILQPRNALVLGMGLYCGYVAAFYIATVYRELETVAAAVGALTGGIGAGFLWTAQGAYFAAASHKLKSMQMEQDEADRTVRIPHADDPSNRLAGIFAFIYLASEVLLRSLSSILLHIMNWNGIFGFYSIVAVISTIGMAVGVKTVVQQPEGTEQSLFYKATAAYRLLQDDRKMKYLIPTTALFGWASAFLSSYVNGEVVHAVLKQDNAIGWLTAWVSCVAALASLGFGRIRNKESILAFGASCFSFIAVIFMVAPHTQSRLVLVLVYTLHGLGRATFEGTLRSTFAELFDDKEGAFANIILQNGTTTAIGFLLSFHLQCGSSSKYCIEYRDKSRHNVLVYEILILLTAGLSIVGCRQAMKIKAAERRSDERTPLVEVEQSNDDGDTIHEIANAQ